MHCANCGQPLAPNAQSCPYCGYPVYGQPYPCAKPPRRGLSAALSDLPRAFLASFTRPGDVLRAMVESRDLFSALIVTALVLILSYLGGVVILRGFIGEIFKAVSVLTGVSMAQTSASMNQGVSYIAGRVGPAVGDIAVLCQSICMLVPMIVYMVYICAIRKVTFSPELALGFATVLSFNTVPAALLAMALSLLSPWLALLVMLCSTVVSYTQAGGMLGFITGVPGHQLAGARLACAALSLFLSLLLCALSGGQLMSGVMRRILVLLSSVGSLL